MSVAIERTGLLPPPRSGHLLDRVRHFTASRTTLARPLGNVAGRRLVPSCDGIIHDLHEHSDADQLAAGAEILLDVALDLPGEAP